MLAINKQRKSPFKKVVLSCFVFSLFLVGGYALTLQFAPALPTLYSQITPAALAATKPESDRLIVPTFGIDISYSADKTTALQSGAWQKSNPVNTPESNGRVVLGAERLSVQPSITETVKKSPFYNIDRLNISDKIILDFGGKRYGYEITSVKKDAATISDLADSNSSNDLVLFGCDQDGKPTGGLVVAKSVGQVTVR